MEGKTRNRVTVDLTDDEMAVLKDIAVKEKRTASKTLYVLAAPYLTRVAQKQSTRTKRA